MMKTVIGGPGEGISRAKGSVDGPPSFSHLVSASVRLSVRFSRYPDMESVRSMYVGMAADEQAGKITEGKARMQVGGVIDDSPTRDRARITRLRGSPEPGALQATLPCVSLSPVTRSSHKTLFFFFRILF